MTAIVLPLFFNAVWWVIVSIPFASPALTTIFLLTNAFPELQAETGNKKIS